MKLDIITVGSALRDTLFYTDDVTVLRNPSRSSTKRTLMCVEYGAKLRSDQVHQGFGGGAYNTAVNFAGLGLSTGTIVSIGNDQDGGLVRENFASHGVDTSYIQVHPSKHTGFSFLLIDNHTGEHTAFIHYGAAANITLSTQDIAAMNPKWLYVSSLNNTQWKTMLTRLSQHPSRLAWNPGAVQIAAGYSALHRILERTHILIVNRDEAIELALSHPTASKKAPSIKQLLTLLHHWSPGVVVLTDGEKGAHAYDGKRYFFQAAKNQVPKDTTGAGDCFGSSFVTGMIIYRDNIQKSLLLAATNAASLVQKIGAQTGLLRLKDLPKSLRPR